MIYVNELYFGPLTIKRSKRFKLLEMLTLMEKSKNYKRSKIQRSKKNFR